MTKKQVYVTTDYHEKQKQRALLQFTRPENANLVREALKDAGREDLIGNSAECLIRPAFGQGKNAHYEPDKRKKRDLAKKATTSQNHRTAGKKAQNKTVKSSFSEKKTAKMSSTSKSTVKKPLKLTEKHPKDR